jgi:8-oxo-dGTP diphosphatase
VAPPSSSNPRPTLRVAAFVTRGARVLLVRQSKGPKTYWLLPGGAVERGETLTEAVFREVHEECGLEVAVEERPIGLVESISPDGGASRHVVHLVFAAFVRGEGEPHGRDPAVDEVAWFAAEALPALIIHPPVNELLVGWLELFAHGAPPSWPPLESTGPRWID